jgi:D-alanyl-D-alanine carboxypeptidase
MWRWWVACVGLGVLLHAVPAPAARAEPRPLASPSTILIDADTGQTLSEEDADAPHPTVGLDQLMVLLLGIEQVEMGTLSLTTPVTVSPLAAGLGSGPTRIPLQADRTYLLGDLMMAMLVGSASDAGLAVAEAVAGSLPACLDLMNARAQRLGLAARHRRPWRGRSLDDGSPRHGSPARWPPGDLRHRRHGATPVIALAHRRAGR